MKANSSSRRFVQAWRISKRWHPATGNRWDMGIKLQPTATPHPSAAELTAFALGITDDTRAAIVEGHIYQCDRCAAVVANAPRDDFIEQLHLAEQSRFAKTQRPAADELSEVVGVPLNDSSLAGLPGMLREHSRYEVKYLLAEGAMGAVYLAVDRNSSKFVAVKVLKPELAADSDKVVRFIQEARIASKLRHPNIAQVLNYESVGRSAYIALEYIPGKTLAQWVAQRGPLPVEEACEYIRQAALGLKCAAEQGIVHRDIKPQNIMLEPQLQRVKILDFGLGRLLDDQRTGTRLTKEGEILGTLDYLSPEQARNSQAADTRCDIYSLGCTFYFLLAGAPPFRGKNAVDVLNKHEHELPMPIRSLRPDVPGQVARLLERMLAKNPGHRPQSPQEIATALQRPETTMAHKTAGRPIAAAANHSTASRLLRAALTPVVLLPMMTILTWLVWTIVSSYW